MCGEHSRSQRVGSVIGSVVKRAGGALKQEADVTARQFVPRDGFMICLRFGAAYCELPTTLIRDFRQGTHTAEIGDALAMCA